jgi:hypothetical protein
MILESILKIQQFLRNSATDPSTLETVKNIYLPEKTVSSVGLIQAINEQNLSKISLFMRDEVGMNYLNPTQSEINSFLNEIGSSQLKLIADIHSFKNSFVALMKELSTQKIDLAKLFSLKDSDGKTALWHATNQNLPVLLFLLYQIMENDIEQIDFSPCLQLAVQKDDPNEQLPILDCFLSCKNEIVTNSENYAKALQGAALKAVELDQSEVADHIIQCLSSLAQQTESRSSTNLVSGQSQSALGSSIFDIHYSLRHTQ